MAKTLRKFQQDTVRTLIQNPDKHFVISCVGCLAKGTPVRLADGSIKPVERIENGDILLSFDERTGKLVPNAVAGVIMSCTQPKPMIELSYDGERITTTYDHYFYSEDGYAPLYQLAWGALETSQRLQLQLLCKQYGQNCDDNLFWRKRSWNNEARQERQVGTPKDSNGWKKCCCPSGYCGNLVEKPIKVTLREPHQLRSVGQQSRKSGVLLKEIQCVSWLSCGEYKETSVKEYKKSSDKRRTERNQRVLSTKHDRDNKQSREEETLRKALQEISNSRKTANTKVRNWSVKIKLPAPYYSICMRQAPYTYCIGRKHNYLVHNSGKGAISVTWGYYKCKQANKHKVLVITTASKVKAVDEQKRNDFEQDADEFLGSLFHNQVTEFETVSWDLLYKWVTNHKRELGDWVYIADEAFKMKNPTSRRGKAFQTIAKATKDWTAYTATPGDRFEDYIAYFQATGLVRNKTHFVREFCIVQTFKGFPEIVGYHNESMLRAWWQKISYAPDTSEMEKELPPSTTKRVSFAKPRSYDQVIKLRQRLLADGTFKADPEYEDIIDNPSALSNYLRRLCFTEDKKRWLKDFLEGLGENCLIFYHYIDTGNELQAIANKALPKDAKIWRIDGSHHEIPTASTIGKHDIVLAQWQSGSEGLNLQFMRYLIVAEPTYVYSTFRQSLGRIARIGQTRAMFNFILATKGTIEDDILNTLRGKQDFALKTWLIGKNLTV